VHGGYRSSDDFLLAVCIYKFALKTSFGDAFLSCLLFPIILIVKALEWVTDNIFYNTKKRK
jgi:hypothetical protein